MNGDEQRCPAAKLHIGEAVRREQIDIRTEPEVDVAATPKKKLAAKSRRKVGSCPQVRAVPVSSESDGQRRAELRCRGRISRSQNAAYNPGRRAPPRGGDGEPIAAHKARRPDTFPCRHDSRR